MTTIGRTAALLLAGWLILSAGPAAGQDFSIPGGIRIRINGRDVGQTTFGGGDGSWTDTLRDVGSIASGVTLGAEHGALFYAYDTLAYPGRPIELFVRLRNAETLVEGVKGATIGFYQGERQLLTAVTDADGYAVASFTPPEAGNHELTARILEVPAGLERMLEVEPAPLLVAAYDQQAPIVVVDLDYTVVGSSFYRVLLGMASPMAGSREVLEDIAKDYRVVYLTQRPDLLTGRSKTWLRTFRYPPGPVLVATLEDAFDSGAYKAQRLAELRQAYPNVVAGIGDKVSDAQAYADAGVDAYLIPHYDPDDPRAMRQLSRELERLSDAVQVVADWQQLRQAFFDDVRYRPAEYARFLRSLALQVLDEQD